MKYHMPIYQKRELYLAPFWKKTCNLCGKEVFGKVERLDGNTYYGFYCKSCELKKTLIKEIEKKYI